MLGLKGLRIDKPEDLGWAWDQAFAPDRPTVLDVVTDPEVANLPPHISFEQAVNMTKTLLKGDPSETHLLKQTMKEAAQSLIPGSNSKKK